MMPKVEFVNPLVKQGNSYCVRVPSRIVKEYALQEGSDVAITIAPQGNFYEYDPKSAETLFGVAAKVRKLARYDAVKKRLFIVILFDFLKETSCADPEKRTALQRQFIEKRRRELGPLVEEFLEFAQTLQNEAFTTEPDGATVLKPQFRKYL